MGKKRTRESLIRVIANTIVHEIVIRHTNRPESKNFLNTEIIEYRGKVENTSGKQSWNGKDLEYIKKKALKKIKNKIEKKYADVPFSKKEAERLLEREIGEWE